MEVDHPSAQLPLVLVALLQLVLHSLVADPVERIDLLLFRLEHVDEDFDSDCGLSCPLEQKLVIGDVDVLPLRVLVL